MPRPKNPVKEILDGLDHLHGKYVHTCFMEQYIDYGDYEFRDEWLVDGYCESYNDLMWWLTELYLIVKGNPAVNDNIKNDMDFFLTDLQRRTQLFNEASSKWDDMFENNQPYAEDDGLWKHYKEDMKKRNSKREL